MSSSIDRRLGAALVLIALAWLWLVRVQIPDAGSEWPGPRGFPLLLGLALAVLGVALVIAPEPGTAEPPIPDPGPRQRDAVVAAGTFGLLVLYAFLLDRAGFLIATPASIALMMAGVLRMRRWMFIAGFAAVFSLGCWIVFNSLLGIPLPRGAWTAW